LTFGNGEGVFKGVGLLEIGCTGLRLGNFRHTQLCRSRVVDGNSVVKPDSGRFPAAKANEFLSPDTDRILFLALAKSYSW